MLSKVVGEVVVVVAVVVQLIALGVGRMGLLVSVL